MRWLATGVGLGLIALTCFNVGAVQGYEHGKKDASQSLRPWGLAVVDADGSCHFYDREVTEIRLPGTMRAHITLAVRPK